MLDHEGDEFPDAEGARANAIGAVRELAAAEIKSGLKISDRHLDVCTAAGELLFSVSFRDVIRSQLET